MKEILEGLNNVSVALNSESAEVIGRYWFWSKVIENVCFAGVFTILIIVLWKVFKSID